MFGLQLQASQVFPDMEGLDLAAMMRGDFGTYSPRMAQHFHTFAPESHIPIDM